MKRSLTLPLLVTVLMISVLVLTACGTSVAPTVENTPVPATEIPSPTAVVPPTSAPVSGACPVGNWQLGDLSAYMASVQNMVNSPDAQIVDQGVTGTGVFTFTSDGSAKFSADNFVQKFTVNSSINGLSVAIPVILTINGATTASYVLQGDQISLSNQDLGDVTIVANVMGTDTNLASDFLMGQPGSIKLYQFACNDANSLSLKVIAIENVDFAPILLTRVP
jgi:hypothetical protein